MLSTRDHHKKQLRPRKKLTLKELVGGPADTIVGITLRIKPALRQRLRLLAEMQKISRDQYVRQVLAKYVIKNARFFKPE